MSRPGFLVRLGLGAGLVVAAFLALASTIVLHGWALLALAIAALVVAGLAASVVQENGTAAMVGVAWKAGAATFAAIVVLTGAAVLAGSVVAGLLGVGLVGAVVTVWALRARRNRLREAAEGGGLRSGATPPAVPDPWALPVSLLSTTALGSEWVRTTTALTAGLRSEARQAIVRRRHDTLDELERRDPDGFARWLAGRPSPTSNPAEFVRTPGQDAG
jgi:hypothetical protein